MLAALPLGGRLLDAMTTSTPETTLELQREGNSPFTYNQAASLSPFASKQTLAFPLKAWNQAASLTSSSLPCDIPLSKLRFESVHGCDQDIETFIQAYVQVCEGTVPLAGVRKQWNAQVLHCVGSKEADRKGVDC
jgi:hypothetical protein